MSAPVMAVLLQTCDRLDYTRRTLDTFTRHNAGTPWLLLHGDDASADPSAMRDLAAAYGFETVVASTGTRRGITATRAALIAAAAKRGAEWCLMLENDIETLRPFPWALFEFVQRQADVYCLRLFGRFKDAQKTVPCKTTHSWERNTPVQWRALRKAPEKAQIGRIHWTPLSSVTRVQDAKALHVGIRPQDYTVRVKKNVMGHFGEPTEGRVL